MSSTLIAESGFERFQECKLSAQDKSTGNYNICNEYREAPPLGLALYRLSQSLSCP